MRITFKDYATGQAISTELTNGEQIEYQGKMWEVTNVGKTMCQLLPVGHDEIKMFIYYERLFNF